MERQAASQVCESGGGVDPRDGVRVWPNNGGVAEDGSFATRRGWRLCIDQSDHSFCEEELKDELVFTSDGQTKRVKSYVPVNWF